MKIQYYLFIILSFLACKQKNNERSVVVKNSLIEKSKNDTILKTKYANNKLKDLIILKDSLGGSELNISYNQNGNIKEKGLVGIVSNKDVNTKTSIKTWFYYDNSKHLDSTIFYNNDVFGKDYIEKKYYFKNGNIKGIEKYNNYILYENNKDSIGTWIIYNEKGKIIKSKEHYSKH